MCALAAVALVLSAEAFGPGMLAAKMFPAGPICTVTLQKYEAHGYNESAIFLSDVEASGNAPNLNWNGATMDVVTYTGGIGMISDLGPTKSLESFDSDCGTKDGLVYSQQIAPKVGHAYVIINNRPTTSTAYFVVLVKSLDSKASTLTLDYGAFEHSVASKKGGDTQLVYEGDLWVKLSQSSPAKCERKADVAECKDNGKTFSAMMTPAGIICSAHLIRYNGNYTGSALFFSDVSEQANAPQIMWDGTDLLAVTYGSGVGLIAELGVVPLEGLGAGAGTQNGLTFTSRVKAKAKTTYLVVSNRPSTNAGVFAIQVMSIDATKQTIDFNYGIIEHTVCSRKSDARAVLGDAWTKLKTAGAGECTYVERKACTGK